MTQLGERRQAERLSGFAQLARYVREARVCVPQYRQHAVEEQRHDRRRVADAEPWNQKHQERKRRQRLQVCPRLRAQRARCLVDRTPVRRAAIAIRMAAPSDAPTIARCSLRATPDAIAPASGFDSCLELKLRSQKVRGDARLRLSLQLRARIHPDHRRLHRCGLRVGRSARARQAGRPRGKRSPPHSRERSARRPRERSGRSAAISASVEYRSVTSMAPDATPRYARSWSARARRAAAAVARRASRASRRRARMNSLLNPKRSSGCAARSDIRVMPSCAGRSRRIPST